MVNTSSSSSRWDDAMRHLSRHRISKPKIFSFNPNLSGQNRRAASKSKAREGSQSCSPFGKKKKCKDKYLAKHSSSECPIDSFDYRSTCFYALSKTKQNKTKISFLQFLTSWMWFLTRRLFSSLLLSGKLLCSSVSTHSTLKKRVWSTVG